MKFTTVFIAVSSVLVGVVNAHPTSNGTHLIPRAPQVITKCTKPNTAAITFDDGPYIYEKTIVDMLNKAGAKGTFFINGNNYACIYGAADRSSLQYAYKFGHQIASHTWSHPHLPTLSKAQITTEFDRIDLALKRILGINPAMMRPPYGEYNNDVVAVANARGQQVIIWDFDSGDSAGVSPAKSKQSYQQLADKHPSTILTLNHETYVGTAHEVVPAAIEILKGKGYDLVTVAECLGVEPYQSTGPAETYDAKTWKC